MLERGASVTRPDAFNKIAIQWSEETGMPTIADKIERANKDFGILAGLEITNAILRLCPPGSIVIPPTDVPLVVVCEDEKDFGREKRKYAEAIPWPKHYSVLGVSTNSPYPTFEYEIQANGVHCYPCICCATKWLFQKGIRGKSKKIYAFIFKAKV